MAPKTASNSTVGSLTERDMKILASAIAQCLKNPVEVDYQKLADVVGLKNPNSAKASWHGVKKKLDAMQIDAGGNVTGRARFLQLLLTFSDRRHWGWGDYRQHWQEAQGRGWR